MDGADEADGSDEPGCAIKSGGADGMRGTDVDSTSTGGAVGWRGVLAVATPGDRESK